jgi:ornithine decarboxylase
MESIKKIVEEVGTPLLVFSANEFKKSYQDIQQYLPRVKHHYALKPLPLKECVEIIDDCEGYIDIASRGEIQFIESVRPELLSKCIYTHPIKSQADIQFAISKGVTAMVVDNIIELEKLIPYATDVRILFRISFSNQEALCDLSEKFGIDEQLFKELLGVAVENKLNVIGCCFHVGSQMKHPLKHIEAIEKCKALYEWANTTFGLTFPVLNIGGGFPSKYGEDDISLRDYCEPIHTALEKLFPTTEIWSEPGRSIAANSMISVIRVIGKAVKNGRIWYYMDDGVFSTYSGVLFELINYDLFPLEENTAEAKLSIFTGPTCDGYDILLRDVMYPELEVGDCVFAKRIGAYSWATRTNFNLLGETQMVHHNFSIDEVEAFIQKSKLEVPA